MSTASGGMMGFFEQHAGAVRSEPSQTNVTLRTPTTLSPPGHAYAMPDRHNARIDRRCHLTAQLLCSSLFVNLFAGRDRCRRHCSPTCLPSNGSAGLHTAFPTTSLKQVVGMGHGTWDMGPWTLGQPLDHAPFSILIKDLFMSNAGGRSRKCSVHY